MYAYGMTTTTKNTTTSKNSKLGAARKAKQDEFYTPLEVVESELAHYKEHFAGKTVFCNCDDPYESAFFKYFMLKFRDLRLKRLIGMSYGGSAIVGSRIALGDIAGLDPAAPPKEPYEIVLDSVPDDITTIEELIKTDPSIVRKLDGDGGFESEESIARLREADIVVTNPPFSRFRDYVAQLVEHEKKFLIIGNKNSVTYKEIWPLVQNGQLWLGVTPMGSDMLFDVPEKYQAAMLADPKGLGSKYRIIDGKVMARASSCWFTNLDHNRRHEEISLWARYAYTPEKYPRYDNFDAIEVSRVNEIPEDYDGLMGVPITFLGKHNPEQFEIIGISGELAGPIPGKKSPGRFYVNGRRLYDRIVIRRN